MDKFYESILHFNRAINRDPNNGVLYLARAQAHSAASDYRAAYDDIIDGMNLIPEWPDVDIYLSETFSALAVFDDQIRLIVGELYVFPIGRLQKGSAHIADRLHAVVENSIAIASAHALSPCRVVELFLVYRNAFA